MKLLAAIIILLVCGISAVRYFNESELRPKINYSDYAKSSKKVECNKNAFVIAIFGQSNSANTVDRPLLDYSDISNLQVYDWSSQNCYAFKEPLPGTTDLMANAITPVAAKISEKLNRPVIVAPFGYSGSSILNWAYGDLRSVHEKALKGLSAAGLEVSVFLWHQGESDAGQAYLKNIGYLAKGLRDKPRQQNYETALKLIIKRSLGAFPNAEFGVAIATKCDPVYTSGIQEAQKNVVSETPQTFISANSDDIGDEGRYQSCHMNEKGGKRLGDMYLDSILKHVK